jgi:hypothetical protein
MFNIWNYVQMKKRKKKQKMPTPDANGCADKNGHLASTARRKRTLEDNKMRRGAGHALSLHLLYNVD